MKPKIKSSLSALALSLGAFVFLPSSPAIAGCSDYPGPGIDWTSCRKRNLILSGNDFSNATLAKANFGGSDMRDSNFTEADLSKALMPRTNISRSDLTRANLTKIEASRSNFSNTKLSGADLSKAEMFRSNFAKAQLMTADLTKAELGRANFQGADLSDAMISFTNLARANFVGATMAGADLQASWTYLTVFNGVDLSGVKNISQEQINLSCGDDKTKLPEGMTRPTTWPCAAED